jgi:hypothetical protein
VVLASVEGEMAPAAVEGLADEGFREVGHLVVGSRGAAEAVDEEAHREAGEEVSRTHSTCWNALFSSFACSVSSDER